MNVSEKLVAELLRLGFTDYFLVTGGAIAPFVDAVGKNQNVAYYCFQHEQAAAMAAEGYYRASGKPAVVLVTSGPGVQNLLNGVCGCWYDSIPCLFISGQVNTKESLDSITSKPRQVGFQETPVEEMFSSVTLFSKKIKTTAEVVEVFSRALHLMTASRKGPVLIDLPVDVQMDIAPSTLCLSDYPVQTFPLSVPENIIQIIKESTRPIVIIGNGCRGTDVHVWLDRTGFPSVTTWAAIDIGHTNTIGSYGVYGDRVANFAVQNADLLIILGSRMDTRQTGGKLQMFSRESKKIMVDIDAEEITKLIERGINIDVQCVGYVEEFLKQVCVTKDCSVWLNTISEWKTVFGKEERKGNVYTFLENLNLPDNCIVIPDQGGNMVWTMQSVKPKKNQRLFTNLGNSSMGWALPAAIGAAIGTKGKVPIVCIEGDGGIQMNIQELSTLSKLNLPVNVIVLNNKGYGIIKQFQDSYFNSRYTATKSNDVFGDSQGLDFTHIARAYGVEAHSEYKGVVFKPVLYDIQIDSDQKIYPKLEFGNALEHMSPMLNLNQYMIVSPVPALKGSVWKNI